MIVSIIDSCLIIMRSIIHVPGEVVRRVIIALDFPWTEHKPRSIITGAGSCTSTMLGFVTRADFFNSPPIHKPGTYSFDGLLEHLNPPTHFTRIAKLYLWTTRMKRKMNGLITRSNLAYHHNNRKITIGNSSAKLHQLYSNRFHRACAIWWSGLSIGY
jgi:hypothetical protein